MKKMYDNLDKEKYPNLHWVNEIWLSRARELANPILNLSVEQQLRDPIYVEYFKRQSDISKEMISYNKEVGSYLTCNY
jgi:hypothetical protein